MSEPLVLQSALGEVAKVPGAGVIIATGSAVPSNGGVGFAPGCLFISYGTYNASTQLYVNSGTALAATWTVLTVN